MCFFLWRSCLLFDGEIYLVSELLSLEGSRDIAVIGLVCSAIERSGPFTIASIFLGCLGERVMFAPFLFLDFFIAGEGTAVIVDVGFMI